MTLWQRFANWFNGTDLVEEPAPAIEKRDDEWTIDQWSQKAFNYQNSMYPFSGYGNLGKSETIDNDFIGYINGAYKQSGAVFAVCVTRMSIFSEARFAWQKKDRERPGQMDYSHKSLDLLETPWPNGTTSEMLARAIQDVDLCGNHYMLRQDGDGRPPRLRRLRPDWVTIVLTAEPEEAISSDILAYIYKPGNTEDQNKWEVFPVDGSNGAVAHWAPIPDPEAQYRGMSWLTPVVREIQADKAISKHKNTFFARGALPSMAVSLHETVTPEKFAEFKRIMDEQYSGAENHYKTMYLGGGADVTPLGGSMKELDFLSITGIGETRIAAAAGVPVAIVGLLMGLQGSTLNEGNFEAARDAFASRTMHPLWRSICSAYDVLVDGPEGHRLWFDDRDVLFLREDRKKVADRQQVEATAISRYVMQGFTPESSVAAIISDDLDLLEHTGLYSVQLLPPEISFADFNASKKAEAEEGKTPAKDGEATPGKKKDGSASKANNTPTGSKRQPVGRPKAEQKSETAWLHAVRTGETYEEDTS